MGLIELLSCVGNDNLEFQKLHDCLTSVKEKKRDKCTELSFLTQAITPNDVAMGTGKIGLVVWVDQDVMSKAYEDANNPSSSEPVTEENLSKQLKETAFDTLQLAVTALHNYACACEIGPERVKAFAIYQAARLAPRAE